MRTGLRNIALDSITLALPECVATLREYERWTILAWTDTSLRYRRTVLGPWWVTISTGVMIGSVGILYGGIFGSELSHYIPFFAAGIIIWTFISGMVTEGCNVFVNAGGLIKSVPAPLVLHVYRMLTRQLIVLAHNAVLIVLLWLIFRWPIGQASLLCIPGLFLVIFAVTGATLTLGILCTRFRDIPQIIGAILQLLFLMTPLVWMPQSLRGKAASWLMDFNPLYHLVEVVRGPILGQTPELGVWIAASFYAFASLLMGLAVYGRFSHRIAYWL